MRKIKKILFQNKIKENEEIVISFSEKNNIILGPKGSGKSFLINLLSALYLEFLPKEMKNNFELNFNMIFKEVHYFDPDENNRFVKTKDELPSEISKVSASKSSTTKDKNKLIQKAFGSEINMLPQEDVIRNQFLEWVMDDDEVKKNNNKIDEKIKEKKEAYLKKQLNDLKYSELILALSELSEVLNKFGDLIYNESENVIKNIVWDDIIKISKNNLDLINLEPINFNQNDTEHYIKSIKEKINDFENLLNPFKEKIKKFNSKFQINFWDVEELDKLEKIFEIKGIIDSKFYEICKKYCQSTKNMKHYIQSKNKNFWTRKNQNSQIKKFKYNYC